MADTPYLSISYVWGRFPRTKNTHLQGLNRCFLQDDVKITSPSVPVVTWRKKEIENRWVGTLVLRYIKCMMLYYHLMRQSFHFPKL